MPLRTALRALITLFALVTCAGAQAQLFRAYLSVTGSDANPCTLAQPCRLLPAALAAVASEGEVWLLDSANYNVAPVAITKSVTILAIPGAVGSVVASGGNAIDIATAGVEVALRNLVVVPLPGAGGAGGVSMTGGAALRIDGCLIANLPQSGVTVTAPARLRIADTTLRDNAAYGVRLEGGAQATIVRTIVSGNGSNGVSVAGTGANTTLANIGYSTLDGNSNGVSALSSHASGVVKVTVHDSHVAQNGAVGLNAQSSAGAVTLTASGNLVANHTGGLRASGSAARIMASGNVVADNFYGFDNSGGVFESSGNNTLRNNSVNRSGTIGIVTME